MKKGVCLIVVLALIMTFFSFSAQTGDVIAATAILYGDADSSGAVDSLDFAAVKMQLLGTKNVSNTKAADVDADGAINAIDLGLIKQFLLGLIIKFPADTGTQPVEPKFHCFLLLGQSNMAGWPAAQASDKVTNPRILSLGYTNNTWAVAVPPLHEAWQGAIGPGDWFAKTIINELPEKDTIGLIPCAISGEKIETFMKSGGSKYNWIIERAKLAQAKGGVIDGILFHQGCSNNGQADWPNKVNTLITDIKKDLGLGDIPVLAGELLYSGGCAGHNTLVNKLPSVVKNSYVISASGLSGDPADSWGLHFNHDSQVTFGKRYAAKMTEVLGW
jgi:hypothetical protein